MLKLQVIEKYCPQKYRKEAEGNIYYEIAKSYIIHDKFLQSMKFFLKSNINNFCLKRLFEYSVIILYKIKKLTIDRTK